MRTARKGSRDGSRSLLRSLAIPVIILAIGLSTALPTAHRVARTERIGVIERELAAQVGRSDARIEYLASLVGGAAAHLSRIPHDPAVMTDRVLDNYLAAIGGRDEATDTPTSQLLYVNRPFREDLDEHVARRQRSLPTFAVGDGPSNVYPAIVWATSATVGIHGERLDVDPKLATAMSESKAQGRVVLSAPTAYQGTDIPVVYVFAPVTDVVDDRPVAWIATTARIDDLILPSRPAGPSVADIWITDHRLTVTGHAPAPDSLQRLTRLEVLGRTWTITASAPVPLFDLPILIAGLSLTLLTAAVAAWGQRSRRQLTSDVADVRRSRDRYASFLEAMVGTIDLGVVACNEHGDITVFNDAARRFHDAAPAGTDLQGLVILDWDGNPYPPGSLMLGRALGGDHIRDEEFQVRAEGTCRTLLANAEQLRDDHDEVIGAVLVLHDITDRKAVEATMTHLAMRDHLTGLANRRRLGQDLEEALRHQREGGPTVTLLFMDLDRFKQVNDTNGHHRGDQMLIDIANRLTDIAHEGDVAARIGGDEFVLLCPHQATAAAAHWLAREIANTLSPALITEGEAVVQAGISIGVVRPGDDTVEDVLRHADLAMYEAKRERDTSIRVYEPALGDLASARYAIESALRRAVVDRSLDVAYQPIIDVASQRVVAAEALVRWEHDGQRQLPAGFLPLAEESGLITDIDLLVLAKACAAVVAHPIQAHISVNLSAKAVALPDLVTRVQAVLEGSGLAASRLCLELTESSLIGASSVLDRALGDLTAMGIVLALDDFGTGYASLNYLRRFPVQVIKIDRSFVKDLQGSEHDRAIVASTVALAARLGLRTVAEGVETAAQADILSDLGCDMLQGYRFSLPTTLEDALAVQIDVDSRAARAARAAQAQAVAEMG